MALDVKFTYSEPIFGKDITIALIPIKELEISPYQRELSPQHVKNLQKSISVLGFIDPLIVYQEGNKYYVINGQHRLTALKELLVNVDDKQIPVVLITKEDALQVLKLNIEKAPSLKDKSIQALKIYKDILNEEPNKVENQLIDVIDEPIYITFGFLYEKLSKFSGSAFYTIFRKVDKFLDVPIEEAYQIRQKRADMLLDLYNKFVGARQKLIERGMNTLEATQYLVSQINPIKRVRNVDMSFEELVAQVNKNLDNFSNTSVNVGDLYSVDDLHLTDELI